MFAVASPSDPSAPAEGSPAATAGETVAARLQQVRVDAKLALRVRRTGSGMAADRREGDGYRLLVAGSPAERRAEARVAAVLVNTGGGMAGGDRLALHVEVEDGASALVTTPSAERIYRSLGPDTTVDVHIRIGAGARLVWLPQETILYDGARFDRQLNIEIDPTGALLLAEMLAFGRPAMGERLVSGRLRDWRRLRRDATLLHAEAVRLDGAIAERVSRPGVAAGAAAVASLLYHGPEGEARLPALRRAMERPGVTAGASLIDGLIILRLVAGSVAQARAAVAVAARVLGEASIPRSWGFQEVGRTCF